MIRAFRHATLLVAASLLFACGTTDPPSAEDPDELDSGSIAGDDVGTDAGSGDDGGDDSSTPSIAPPRGQGADGVACTSDSDCAGGKCITGGGWRGGYCSSQPCADAEADCNPGDAASSCFVRDVTELPWCGRTCRSVDDCRNGYDCLARGIGGTSICMPESDGSGPIEPPGPSDPPSGTPPPTDVPTTEPPPIPTEPQADGEPCTADEHCEGGSCLMPPDWPGGYCSTVGCSTRADCATDGGEVDNRCLQQSGDNFCVRMCGSVEECRSGYECRPVGQGNAYCAPSEDTPVDPPPAGDAEIGDACTSDADCGDLSCATGWQYPEGYCTVDGCENDAECGAGAFCLNTFINQACIKRCASDGDCRDGYNCGSIPGVQSPEGCIASLGGGGGGIPGF